MTIHRLLKKAAFGPEEIECLVTAYEKTLRALGLKDRSDPITLLVAEKIIALVQCGVRDAGVLCATTLQELKPDQVP